MNYGLLVAVVGVGVLGLRLALALLEAVRVLAINGGGGGMAGGGVPMFPASSPRCAIFSDLDAVIVSRPFHGRLYPTGYACTHVQPAVVVMD